MHLTMSVQEQSNPRPRELPVLVCVCRRQTGLLRPNTVVKATMGMRHTNRLIRPIGNQSHLFVHRISEWSIWQQTTNQITQ